MSGLGIRLTLLAGSTLPTPLPPTLLEALESATVTHSDRGRSGFQLTFRTGRSRRDGHDHPLLKSPQLKPRARVLLVVTFGVVPYVLMDGIITDQQFAPTLQPGSSTITLTGEDLSYWMDREEVSTAYPAQSVEAIVRTVLGKYSAYGIQADVRSAPTRSPRLASDRQSNQVETDLAYVQKLANHYQYVFYVSPGPTPGQSTAYWGPRIRPGLPQPALSFNQGPISNVDSLNFQNSTLQARRVAGYLQDAKTHERVLVQSRGLSTPTLSRQPPDLTLNDPTLGQQQFRDVGLTIEEALARVQAISDGSTQDGVTATGELNVLRYGRLLQARKLVDLRGAGHTYDGTYYVSSVTHTLSQGRYQQRFSLMREGTGPASDRVQL